VHLAFTDEQALIRDTAHEFCAEHGERARVRRAIESPLGYDEATWRAIGEEIGWCGIALPGEFGGAGLGAVELAILCEQMGRVLLPSPFLATVALAAPAIALAGTDAQRERVLPGIAAGRTRATLAIANAAGAPGLDGIGPHLERSRRGWRLDGAAGFVVHADAADLLVVAARAAGSQGADGVSLLLVAPDDAGVSIERLTMLDQTRPMSHLRFDAVVLAPDSILGEAGEAGPALATALACARTALAAEQLGGAEAVLDIATEHAKTRVQFDRPIGSFQAVKHRLADMMVATEAARSAAYYAACAVDELPDELEEAAAVASAWCSETFSECAAGMIQLLGGVGFTWEHVAHLYFKRARAASTLLGTPAWQRERIAKRLLGQESGDTAWTA
jgi:alkylation response protein AidB-like acyl-CoA dehydrogenase